MKGLILFTVGAFSSVLVAATADGKAPDSGPPTICTQVELLTRTGRTNRRVCLTAAQWRARLGPDWSQNLSGRSVEDDMDLVYLRAKETAINPRPR
jgi:hypothetical protein